MPRRNLGRISKLFTESLLCIVAIYSIYKLLFTTYDVYEHMVAVLLFVLPLTFIIYSSGRKDVNRIPWYDYLLALTAAISVFDIYINYAGWFFRRMWLVTPLTLEQLVVGAVLILLIVEAARRTTGTIFAGLISVFIVYLLLAPYLPVIGFRTNPARVVEYLYLTPYGIFSTPLEVMSTYVIAFTLLGAAFAVSGTGEFFINLAKALVGKSSGGPAKVSVIASSLVGTITGSAVANVYTTGIFTIPTMKSVGFPAYFAGAVEAVASTGGQIMPPIMGAGAFIMAELLGVPYVKIMIAAIIPALIYYLGVYVQIHYYAVKSGLRGLPNTEIPNVKDVLVRRGYYIIPLAVLIYMITILMWSPVTSALITLFIALAVSYVRRSTWMTPKRVFKALVNGIDEVITIVVIAAVAGMIAGSVTYSGLTLKFSYLVNVASMGITTLALLYTALLTILLGMGMPTTAAYVLAASVAVPAIISMGVDALAAHMFTFWYAILSAITPPVALAAYAAATLAKDHPVKVAIWACKLGFSAFVVPFLLIYRSSILLGHGNTSLTIAMYDSVIAFLATYAIAIAFSGYLRRELKLFERILLIVGGIILYIPGTFYDLAGLLITGLTILAHILTTSHLKKYNLQTR